MDATLIAGEGGSQLSANLVLSDRYLYVIIHDSVRHLLPLQDIADVKEQAHNDRKLFLLTIRRPQEDASGEEEERAPAREPTVLSFVIPRRSAKSAFLVQLAHLLAHEQNPTEAGL